MAKKLLKNLFTTFILSIIVSIAAICIFYAVSQKGTDYGHAVPLIIKGSLYLNLILLLMSSPALFLSYPHIWNNKAAKFLLYFSGPIVFVITTLSLKSGNADKVIYLLAGLMFLIIHSLFFYKLTKSNV
jgi:hypothetical protein